MRRESLLLTVTTVVLLLFSTTAVPAAIKVGTDGAETVLGYVSNVLHKLQVADRKQAAARAREAGMGGERAL